MGATWLLIFLQSCPREGRTCPTVRIALIMPLRFELASLRRI
jgi:hypothetical protein